MPIPTLVEAQDWGWRYASRPTWAARNVTFTVEPGERVLLLGASGAGKSTLLHGLAGILGGPDEGNEEGRLLINGMPPTAVRGTSALVMQDPHTQIALTRVGDEVAFGCENLGVARKEIWRRVETSLDAVGLLCDAESSVRRRHPTHQLSGGQMQRLVLAGALAMHPGLLLLDEPTANIDPAGVAQLRQAVANVVSTCQHTLIVVEHRVDVWADLVDRVIVLSAAGGLLADGTPAKVFTQHQRALEQAGVWLPRQYASQPADPPAAAKSSAPEQTLLTAKKLSIGYGKTVVQEAIDLTLPAGGTHAFTGPNGCGKTTLALTMAGLLPALSGSLYATKQLVPPRRSPDPHSWRSQELLTRIGTVFQLPEHQFVATHVDDEIAVGLHALGWRESRIATTVSELLERLALTDVARANPFTLSGGQKRRLSVATVLATAPELLFLDEPTFGQDRNTWWELVELINTLSQEGKTILSVTHDAEFLAATGACIIDVSTLGNRVGSKT